MTTGYRSTTGYRAAGVGYRGSTDVVATGSLPTITLSGPVAIAVSSVGATGSLPTITLSGPAAIATAAASVSVSLPTVTVVTLGASAAGSVTFDIRNLHTVARDILISCFQDPAVADAAGITHGTWVDRVMAGDRDGYIGKLHRGRLPAVEITQLAGEEWTQLSFQAGMVKHSWLVRIHVAAFDQTIGETLARAILYAGLIKVRALIYWNIGVDIVGGFNASAIGHYLECTLTCENTMERADYETTPVAVNVAPTSEGDVGGISTTINWNSTSPVAVLVLPADQSLDTVSVEVVTPFDGTAPTVTIGVAGDQARYMATTDSDITEAGSVWEKDTNDVGPLTVNVWVGGTGATQGQLKVQLSVTNA